jgi:tetratricopeptide (TPR) repeat protein
VHLSTDNRVGLGHTLMDIAEVHRDAGRYGPAAQAVDAALVILSASGDLQSEAGALTIRGQIKLRTHGVPAAVPDLLAALAGARRIGARYTEAETLSSLAATLAGSSPAEAIAHARAALAIADPAEFRLIAGRARTALAVALAADGNSAEALATVEAAVALHRETGHRLGEAKALAVTSLLQVHDPAGANSADQAARAIIRACGAPESVLTWPGWDSAATRAAAQDLIARRT